MAIITITATELGSQIISGIPMLLALETNIPATIFYTFDGSEPTLFSAIYLESLLLPTISTVRVRAMAVSGADRGYFDITYSTDTTSLVYPRRIEGYGAGLVVDAYNIEAVLHDGYGVNSDNDVVVPVRYSDYELEDLEIKYSRTGPDGEGPGTILLMGAPPTSQLDKASAVDWNPTTPNHQNAFFNPRSLYIMIDGRDGYDDQIVSPHVIINRPWGSTRDSLKYLQGKEMYEPQPYISGGHVRTFYNYQKGIAVAYYFDSNETRWIRSVQSFDPTTVPRYIGMRRMEGTPLVFKWIYNKRSMI